jgi:hypothetical protein
MKVVKLWDGFLQCFFLHSLVVWIVVLSNIIGFPAYAEDNLEYKVKATFIANFTIYTDWPDGKAKAKQSKIDVCVLGDNALINYSQIFKQTSSAKLNISLVRENNLANVLSHCYVVFIGALEEGSKYKDALSMLKNKPVLTVGDSPDFIERGGMIGFSMDNGRVRFIVNKKVIEKAGMYIDAQLLEIAFKVIDD